MRVEMVEQLERTDPPPAFPPEGNYVDLRADAREVDRIAGARRYLPLRNFLSAVNGEKSIFTTACATTKADLPACVSAGLTYEFASQARIVFAEPFLNFERNQFVELGSGLKELLERDPSTTVRAVLRINCCDFTAQNRRGFCLDMRLVAEGDSAQQAEFRWGIALARVQQALLFRSRPRKQQMVE